MPARFFSHTPIETEKVTLTGSEHQHMTKVMRSKAGDQVTLFDGSGWEFLAQIDRVERQASELSILQRAAISRELTQPITLAVALPKGERQQWLVEKATELGVHTMVPLICQRGVAQPGERARARMQKWVIAACKQCGRNQLLDVAPPQSLPDFVQAGDLIAHPDTAAVSLQTHLQHHPPATRIVVGPEGGFSPEEIKTVEHAGCHIVRFGPRVLRIETAAVALIAAMTAYSS